jgi:hypothetical protein
MKFQPLCAIAAIFAAVLVAQSALADSARADRFNEAELLDPTCTAVNEAYVNTHKGYYYRELIHQPFKRGETKAYIEIIYTAANIFQRYSGRPTWQKSGIPEIEPYERRYTSCTFVDSLKGAHYYANWHKPGYLASAEVWLTQDGKKLAKVVRRYPPEGKEFPFSTVISTFDYNAQEAKRPADASVVAPYVLKEDVTCDAVNAAYRKTRRRKEYSEIIAEGTDDLSLRPYIEVRVNTTGSFQKYVSSPANKWVPFDPQDWSTFDQHGPKFTDCSFLENATIGAAPTTHYTARWHNFLASANFDVWISHADGRIVKTVRRHSTWGIRQELFNYDPASSVVPRPQLVEDRRSFGLSDRVEGEDPSCDVVNRAYERTYRGNLATRVYSVQRDGTIDALGLYRFIGNASYDRRLPGRWHKRHRGMVKTMDGIGAVFRNCKLVSRPSYGRIPTLLFTVDWARRGYNASSEVWISEQTQKFIKVIRRFRGKSEDGFEVLMDFLETRRELIEEPSDFVDLR